MNCQEVPAVDPYETRAARALLDDISPLEELAARREDDARRRHARAASTAAARAVVLQVELERQRSQAARSRERRPLGNLWSTVPRARPHQQQHRHARMAHTPHKLIIVIQEI